MSDWIGKTLGKVVIENRLGRGGMAEVYRGTHITLQRTVAVKILHGFLEDNADLHERFQREARVVAGLRHPNIVQVFDFDLIDGQPFIVMEYVNGPSLSAYLRSLHERQGRVPIGQIARLLPMLSSALDYAHSQGIVHRDIKPGNVLLYSRTQPIRPGEALPRDSEPMLSDFGLVRVMDSATQTSSGIITGTPAYMSPEQARGDRVDYRTDVYSLGVILYEMLAGQAPFDGDTSLKIINKVINEPPPRIRGISPQLQAVLERALHKNPAERYQSAGELTAAFLNVLGMTSEAATILPSQSLRFNSPGESDTALRPRRPFWIPASIGAGLTLLAIFGIWSFMRPSANLTPDAAATAADIHGHTLPADTPAAVGPIPPDGSAPVGRLRFEDVAAALDGATVSVEGIVPPPQGSHFEVWLIGDGGETRRSLGVLELDESGSGSLTFVDGESRNLLSLFDRMEITLEPSPDPSPNPSGRVAFSSAIPPNALVHVRHVLVSIGNTPERISLVHGLWKDAALIDQYANEMLSAFDSGDAVTARLKAEAVFNLLVGNQSPEYGDLDGDGTVTDPGDGYGFLLNGDSPGYTGGVMSHTEYAMFSGDASEAVIVHGEHVRLSIKNVERWAVELRDLVRAIARGEPNENVRQSIVEAVGIADKLLSGVDLNGDERISPVPGEGGVATVYEHAYYMADMSILPGEDQVMPPGPTPEATPQPYNEK